MAGLTETGFETKTFSEIKSDLERDFRNIFGDDINLSSTSLLGGLIGILANRESQLWEAGNSTYLSRYVDTADGISLDRIVNILQITRKRDFNTSGEVFFFGDVNVNIPAGTVVSNNLNNNFNTLESVTTIAGATPIIKIIQNVSLEEPNVRLSQRINTNNLYGLFQPLIGEVPEFSYSEDLDVIKSRLESYFGAGAITSVIRNSDNSLTINFTNREFIPGFEAFGFNVEVIRAGRADGIAVSVDSSEAGILNIAAGQITNIETPISGINRVINFFDFISGRLSESDSEIRNRWNNRVKSPTTSSKDSIEFAIEEIDGVLQAIIFENENGSFEIVVNGGIESDIAKAIILNKPVGIGLTGNVIATTTDARGNIQLVRFSRPTILNVFVKVNILRDRSNFAIDGVDIIRNLLNEYQYTLSIGALLKPSPDMIWALNNVEGLNSLSIEISVGNEDNYSSNNYQLANREIASFAKIEIREGDRVI